MPKAVQIEILAVVFALGGCSAPVDAESSQSSIESLPNHSGTLVEARGEHARANVCAAVDASGNITRIDDFDCRPAYEVHGCTANDCPWLRCGECLMYVYARDDGSFFVAPPKNGSYCDELDGGYELSSATTCHF
jgi:hypothetical protein